MRRKPRKRPREAARGAVGALALTPEELESRAKRAARFEAPPGSRWADEDTDDNMAPVEWDENDDDEGASRWRVVGAREDLLKPYLRLTAAPRPRDVRPPRVLEKTLDKIEAAVAGGGDYRTWAEQYKSARQDLTVQGVRGALARRAYEGNARFALAANDLDEFHQCQVKLRDLHALGVEDDGVLAEFAALGALHALSIAPAEATRAIARCLSFIDDPRCAAVAALATARARSDPFAVVRAAARCDAAAQPLVAPLLDRGRRDAFSAALRVYAPELPVARLHELLGFADEPAAGDAFLAARDVVTDASRAKVLVRESRDAYARLLERRRDAG